MPSRPNHQLGLPVFLVTPYTIGRQNMSVQWMTGGVISVVIMFLSTFSVSYFFLFWRNFPPISIFVKPGKMLVWDLFRLRVRTIPSTFPRKTSGTSGYRTFIFRTTSMASCTRWRFRTEVFGSIRTELFDTSQGPVWLRDFTNFHIANLSGKRFCYCYEWAFSPSVCSLEPNMRTASKRCKLLGLWCV